MNSKIISTEQEFFCLREEWERLQAQDIDVTYYSTYEYIKTWWDVYKADEKKLLFIICVYNNNELVGIAPFIIEKQGKWILRWNSLSFLGVGDYFGIILKRNSNIREFDIIKNVFSTLDNNKILFDRVALRNIKSNTELAWFLLKNPNYNIYFKYSMECPVIEIKEYETYLDYGKRFIGSKVKGIYKKFQKDIKYNFKVVNNKFDYDIYDRISELHIKEKQSLNEKRANKDRKSLYEDPFYSKFVKEIFKNNEKVLTFIIEDQNGKLIIYSTCYLYNRRLYAWNTAFDLKYVNYRMGRVINLEIVKYLFENPIADSYDIGAGRYPWKFEWTNRFTFDYSLLYWNETNKKVKLLKKADYIAKLFKK